MNFCSNCGSDQLQFRIPADDHRARWVCSNCEKIHYSNPNMVVGCLIVDDGRIMLARRGIEPRMGYWNLPCGFLEDNETVEEGAMREVIEETGAWVELDHLHAVYSLPHSNQVYLIFLAHLTRKQYHTTPESTEIRFFGFDEIPWNEIAFSSNSFAISSYIDSDESGKRTYVGSFPTDIYKNE